MFFVFYFIKISKFALPGVMLMYERTSKDRKKESVPLQVQLKINVGISKCPPMRNIGINISYIFDFTKVN